MMEKNFGSCKQCSKRFILKNVNKKNKVLNKALYLQYQIKNVKAMKAKFKVGQKVTIKQGELYYNGIITKVGCNLCTWETEYNVDYYKGGTAWTLIGVPENAITPK